MTQRAAHLLGLLIVAGILGTGFYLEYELGIMPCPLCTLQRMCFGITGILFLAGVLLYRRHFAVATINFLTMLFSAAGLFLAARQMWIQAYPSSSGSDCGVSLQFMLGAFPLTDVIQKIFSGSAECTQRGWEFLHLNIPEWSLLFFAIFFLGSCFYLFRGCRRCQQ